MTSKSAYTGDVQEKVISKYKMENKVHEKGYRNKPLTEEQKANNREKSKTRARVEHVFGFMEQSVNGLMVRSVGIVRATGVIGLMNLTYNLFRYEQVVRLNILQLNDRQMDRQIDRIQQDIEFLDSDVRINIVVL